MAEEGAKFDRTGACNFLMFSTSTLRATSSLILLGFPLPICPLRNRQRPPIVGTKRGNEGGGVFPCVQFQNG
jgi:hypothetical protein